MSDDRLRDRFRGALLGAMVGDALGAPVEGVDCDRIAELLGEIETLPAPEAELRRAVLGLIAGAELPPGAARYTDDTQMTIGLAESLIACGGFDGADLARRFSENFEPHRGYGPGAALLMVEFRRGAPWDEPAGKLFRGQGSFGNGAAMRAAPVGLFARRDAYRMRHLAENTAKVTHTHPLGVAGCVLQSAAVAVASRSEPGEDFDPLAFLDAVEESAPALPDAYGASLADVRRLLRDPRPIREVAEILDTGVEAHESVPAALYAFASHPHSFEAAVAYAVRLGGDADTIGAMCGAVAGAFHGAAAIPAKWTDALENGPRGRDYILDLADRLRSVSRA